MLLPQDKAELSHVVVGYDPGKAHEYYLRTRKLHPRQKGQQAVAGLRKRASGQPAGRKSKASSKQVAEAAAAVKQLSKKLTELKGVLALKKAAQRKKPTAADKHEKARDSKKYRQKHKQVLKTKAKHARAKAGGGSKKAGATGGGGSKKVIANPKSGSITEVESAIKTIQSALNTAKARQRALG